MLLREHKHVGADTYIEICPEEVVRYEMESFGMLAVPFEYIVKPMFSKVKIFMNNNDIHYVDLYHLCEAMLEKNDEVHSILSKPNNTDEVGVFSLTMTLKTIEKIKNNQKE